MMYREIDNWGGGAVVESDLPMMGLPGMHGPPGPAIGPMDRPGM